MRTLFFFLCLGMCVGLNAQQPLPIFDAHLHYSHDAWELVPVPQAIEIMRKAGLKRALISSAGDDGQQRLYQAAPDLVIPELRPYRTRADVGTWFRDESVIPYLEDRLRKYKYAGIGEFHLYGADADLPVPRRMVELARKHGLFLHAHSDVDAVERLFRQWPQARILWAHSGFDRPERVAEMLKKHNNLWADLAFRTEHASNTPERWHYIQGHADWSRRWLGDLPRDVAERIAWKNGEQVFGSLLQPY
jgi:hypothetical protein